jgi:hypothetical protein
MRSPAGCRAAPELLGHDGRVLTYLLAVAAPACLNTLNIQGALTTPKAFGVGRAFAVLVAIFTLMFALMVLGGHLRASRQRRRKNKRL